MKYDNKNDELILQEPHSNYLLFVFEENEGKCKKSPDVMWHHRKLCVLKSKMTNKHVKEYPTWLYDKIVKTRLLKEVLLWNYSSIELLLYKITFVKKVAWMNV